MEGYSRMYWVCGEHVENSELKNNLPVNSAERSISNPYRPHGKGREHTQCLEKLWHAPCARQQTGHETGDALKNTLNGLATCSRYLLCTIDTPLLFDMNTYSLGFFQHDDMEHHFGHFRRSNGCNYYVSVREVMSTHFLDRTKEMLNFEDFDTTESTTASHQCDLCSKELTLAER